MWLVRLGYRKTTTSILLTLSCSHWLTPMEATAQLWAALWRSPHGKELREASTQQPVETEAVDPTTHEKPNPTNKKLSQTMCESSLSVVLRWLQPQLTPQWQPPEKPWVWGPRSPTHRDCEIVNVCCFKLLRLGVICYTAINNWYIIWCHFYRWES